MSILKPGLEERYKRVKQSLADDEMRFGREPEASFTSGFKNLRN